MVGCDLSLPGTCWVAAPATNAWDAAEERIRPTFAQRVHPSRTLKVFAREARTESVRLEQLVGVPHRAQERKYLLRGVIHCGIDGLSYCGTQGRGEVGWYRCTGQMVERGPLPGRCWGQSIRTDAIEPQIWADIERWLRDPGDILDELDGQRERDAQGAVAVAESITLARALDALESQRRQALALSIRGRLDDAELDAELDRIAADKTELDRRVAALEPPEAPELPEAALDLLAEVRARLDAGLTEEQRQEIVRLLVRITIHTETAVEGGMKTARAIVEYRFPAVVETRTGMDSWPPRAGSAIHLGISLGDPGPPPEMV